MSSPSSTTPLEIISTTTPSSLQDDFAQTKEDFDVSSIPDSDSEDESTIYDQTSEKGKKVDESADGEIVYDTSIADKMGDEGRDDEGLEDNTIVQSVILSRFSTPTTDELMGYIIDTDLLGVGSKKVGEEALTTYHQKLEELARIRAVITRSQIPDTHQITRNYTSALAVAPISLEVQNSTTHLPPGTPLIRDFAVAPLPCMSNPHNPYTLSTPQVLRGTDVLKHRTLQSCTYPSTGIRTMYHYHGVLFRHAVNGIHAPSDKKEEEEEEKELDRELSAGEEADDEEYMYISTPEPVIPRAPVLGNRNVGDFVKIEEIEEIEDIEESKDEKLFQILPSNLEKSRQPKEDNLKDSEINVSNPPTIISPLAIHKQHPQPYQLPRINAWPLIALTYHIPIFPTHMLTSSSLTQLSLCEKSLQQQNGYSDSPLDQWALTQHRLFLWINSGALENGIEGEMRRLGSADALLGEESSEMWDYEDVEVFARWEGDTFRRCLEWVQDVEGVGEREGKEWGGVGLENEVYDFCGEEEILHRSASIASKEVKKHEGSSSSSYISEEYDAEDERGEIRSAQPSFPLPKQIENADYDPRLGRVVNIFRTRTLHRLGITSQNSSFRQPINHTAFRETGIQAADYSRANATARFERVAEDFARREGGGREGGVGEREDSVGQAEQAGWSENRYSRFDSAEVHMRGGAGSEDSGKESIHESFPTGSKSRSPLFPSASDFKASPSLLCPHL
ncbi:hypothetical protein BELL_0719g00040 [Botrytis elliptica]|uniref:Uncharacterized protein n=1 Tax=Botrytis elliptica TaxID=278938 RepID=A0A4Z1JB66_9HELO|nr:hypothetical protein EAE99_011798 [Botrytis elliptica]TGO70484.1 hypothetical protein BELL_0719g00040 [Botrytis elliptica]